MCYSGSSSAGALRLSASTLSFPISKSQPHISKKTIVETRNPRRTFKSKSFPKKQTQCIQAHSLQGHSLPYKAKMLLHNLHTCLSKRRGPNLQWTHEWRPRHQRPLGAGRLGAEIGAWTACRECETSRLLPQSPHSLPPMTSGQSHFSPPPLAIPHPARHNTLTPMW